MILDFYNNNMLKLPESDCAIKETTHNPEANYINVFYSNFFNKRGEFLKKRKQHFRANYNLKEIIEGLLKRKIKSYSELFGGVGIKALIYCDDINNTDIMLNELSSECCDVLRENFRNAEITNEDAFIYEFKKNYEVSVIDFNNYSLGKYNKRGCYSSVIKNVVEHTTQYIVLNDCTISYLNRGGKLALKTCAKYMGVDKIKDIQEYYLALISFYERELNVKVISIQHCEQTDFILLSKLPAGYYHFKFNTLFEPDLELPIIKVRDELFGGWVDEIHS